MTPWRQAAADALIDAQYKYECAAAIIALVRHGLARFEGFEFCFNGLRYSHRENWTALVEIIGWDKVRAAIEKAATHG